MNPRLIVIAGPSQGHTFNCTEKEISIGRDASNQIRLIDPSISRRHSLIKEQDERFVIKDLDSFNGTFVNGIPIMEQEIVNGDQLAIGDALLLFLVEQESTPNHPAVEFDDGTTDVRTTVSLQRRDAFYLQPDKVLAALPPTARIARDLNVLLRISTAINSIHDRRSLQYRLLELILEVIPAERAAILLVDEATGELIPSTSWSRNSGEVEKIAVSRTIALRVLDKTVALLTNDVSIDPSIDPATSLMSGQARALLCVPLVVLDKPVGVIYLDQTTIVKPFDEDHLQLMTAIAGIAAVAIGNTQYGERLREENHRLSEEINLTHQMIGESQPMQKLYQFLAKVAPTEASVILRGESGTGKELAARAIHANSPRASEPYVAINCAVLAETLLESELFGHEKGAFTGAVGLKRGKLEIANGGTLFLDEVGELAPNIQAKLLRVLQEREFERVGGNRPIKVDVRIIAATNRDLESAIQAGGFRKDLYYRLNVISYVLPPLRERGPDILLLANYFAAKASKRSKRKPIRLSTEARSYLENYDWPGNVRELENVIERAVILSSTEMITPDDLPEVLLDTAARAGAPISKYYEAVQQTKKELILKAIKQSNYNHTEAAKLLGVHPNNLHRLIRNMNLKDRL